MRPLDILIRILMDDATRARLHAEGIEPRGFSGLWRAFLGHFSGFALHNPWALAAGAVFAWSLGHPWWFASVYNNYSTIRAYPYVLWHDLPPEGVEFVIETPKVLVVLFIMMLVGQLFLLFWGSTTAGRKGRLLLIWSGLLMLLYTAGFYASILFATRRVGVPVRGSAVMDYTVPVDVIMDFQPPYYVAMASAVACVLLSLLHEKPSIRFYRRGNG